MKIKEVSLLWWPQSREIRFAHELLRGENKKIPSLNFRMDRKIADIVDDKEKKLLQKVNLDTSRIAAFVEDISEHEDHCQIRGSIYFSVVAVVPVRFDRRLLLSEPGRLTFLGDIQEIR